MFEPTYLIAHFFYTKSLLINLQLESDLPADVTDPTEGLLDMVNIPCIGSISTPDDSSIIPRSFLFCARTSA